MKTILVTPHYHQPRGNTITVDRISRGLNKVNIETEVISISEDSNFPPFPKADIIHGFHAYHFYRYLCCRGFLSIPYIITLTGTDLNHYLFDKKTRRAVIDVLHEAKAIHVFSEAAKNKLAGEVPELKEKTFIIPQGVHSFPYRKSTVKKDQGSFLFVIPAGIRKIKNVPQAISMLSSLYQQNSKIRLWIVGPIIEEDEGKRLKELVEQNSGWVTYLGEYPHHKMVEIYQEADVVLNTSLSEGQPSTILEAMTLGIPVLASKVAGNRDMVLHNKTGFLYSNEEEFKHYAQLLIVNNKLRKELGLRGKEYVKKNHSVEKEVEAFKNIYHQILNQDNQKG